MDETIPILIADDHPLVRQGLRYVLAGAPEMPVVGEAINGQQVIDWLPTTPARVVLMDIRMPVLDGIQATLHIVQHFPQVNVLGLSLYDEPYYTADMLRAGALGCIPKGVPSEVLFAAVRTVARGESYRYRPEVSS
jgi:DNA-binding NarL/FixJ family response regulator